LVGHKEIASPRILEIRFRIVGWAELKASDIEGLPSVESADGSVVAFKVFLEEKGRSMPNPVTGTQTGNKIEAPRMLLNSGDSLVFRLLVDGGEKPPHWSLRASGFKVIERGSPAWRRRRLLILSRWPLVAAGLTGIVVAAASLIANS
jgi:hypothetical protein